MPVNLSKGTVQVNVPLCELEGYSMRLPVSLSYQTSGLKVNDVPSQVGLGWSLNGGGLITRVVRGRPDDDFTTDRQDNGVSLYTGYTGPGFDNTGTGSRVAQFISDNSPYRANSKKFVSGTWDSEPDVFYFNFNGFTGRFVLDQNKNPVLVPHQNLKINLIISDDQGYPSNFKRATWAITTPDGTSYIFGFNDPSEALSGNSTTAGVETTTHTTNVPRFTDCLEAQITTTTFASSWYLKKVISPQGNTEMTFDYAPATPISYTSLIALKYVPFYKSDSDYPECSPVNVSPRYVQAITRIDPPLYLSRITAPGKGRIEFSYANAVLSDGVQGGQKLTRIQTFNSRNQVLKTVHLGYSYFLPADRLNPGKRLRLDQVVEEGQRPYVFEYHYNGLQNGLPARNTTTVDHWGYFNGLYDNPLYHGIPGFTYTDYLGSLSQPGANRTPNEFSTQTSMLKKISFPGGSSTEYFFELNRFWNGTANESFGGLRIQKIITRDGIQEANNQVTTYSYVTESNASRSSGTVDPVFASPNYIKTTEFVDKTWFGLNVRIGIFILASSQPYNPHDLVVGDAMVYRCVTVTQSGKGRTVYHFTSFADSPDVPAQKSRAFLSDQGRLPYNTPNTTRYFTRGLPTDIKVYSESGQLKSWKRLEYRLAESFPSVRRVPGIVFHRQDLVGSDDYPMIFQGVYYEESYWMHPTRVTDILYDQDDASRFSRQVTEYQYNAKNLLVSETKTTDSEGRSLMTRQKYSVDYGANMSEPECIAGCGSAIHAMARRHMVGLPIETQVWQQKSAAAPQQLLSASLQTYVFLSRPYFWYLQNSLRFGSFSGQRLLASIIVPRQVLQLHTDTPLTNYQSSTIDANGQLSYDARFTLEATMNQYSPTGLLLEGQRRDDQPNAAIYEQTTGYVMAKISNASANQVAYTSFETSGETGNWTYTGATTADAQTGLVAYASPQPITSRTDLPEGKYRVSFWLKGSGNLTVNGLPFTATDHWVYREVQLTNPGTVTLQPGSGVLLDELRLHPVGASMTTHTYIPQVGVHSQTDDNGKTSYYEYDDQQRVKLVRDQNRNIVKQYQYRMKDRDAPIWINTGNTRCEIGENGPTGKITEEQQDIHPGHRVNGAAPTRWVTEVYYPSDCPTCSREGQKFVNGTCLQGIRVNDSSTSDRQGNYVCIYHYEFADGTSSGSYTSRNRLPCPL